MSGAASQSQGPAFSVRPRPQHQTIYQVVGRVTETKEQYLQRHDGGLRTCPRCRYYQHKKRWEREYGCEDHASRRIAGAGAVWLAERPVRWGGFWGLGCTFCADAVARLEGGDSAGQVCARRLRTTWARFEVRAASLQAEHLTQHRLYDNHRVAVLGWLRPDAPVELRLQASLSDDRLLAGSVPQPEDWIRAWRAARTPKSWQAAAESCESEHFGTVETAVSEPALWNSKHG